MSDRLAADASAEETGAREAQFDDDEVELIAAGMRKELHADAADLPDEPAKKGEWQ